MTRTTVLKNLRILDPSRNLDEKGSIVIENGRIAAIGAGAQNQGAPEGAEIVDPAEIPSIIDTDAANNFLKWGTCAGPDAAKGKDAACSVVMKYGMKRDFNAWLDSLKGTGPVKTLTELRAWNTAHQNRGAIKYQQANLDVSDEMDVEKDKARWEADRAKDIRLGATHGIDEVMKAHKLDAILESARSSSQLMEAIARESSEQAASLLLWLSIAVVIAMFFILAAAFSSSSLAALIMVNLPLALIGGIAGVFVSGGVLSIASIIGLIALLGIAARNGIMLVSHIEYLRHEEGVTGLREAVVRGSIDRVVPILMTALCTGLALVPVALGAGEPGSEIQAPMATVIIFGLVSSTALNMLVVPAAYYAAQESSRPALAGQGNA